MLQIQCFFCFFSDEVPPLEDMSDELELLRSRSAVKAASKPTEKKQQAVGPKKKQVQGGFGGLKKGFLSSSCPSEKTIKPAKPAASSEKVHTLDAKEKIPHLKKSKASGLELPEVQEAMKDSFPFLEKNGV